MLAFVFFVGFGATLAEPALNALGTTTEDLTDGQFKKQQVILIVACGVACGCLLGALGGSRGAVGSLSGALLLLFFK